MLFHSCIIVALSEELIISFMNNLGFQVLDSVFHSLLKY